MNEKRVDGDNLSWHLSPRHDHSDTLSVGLESVKVGDPDEPKLYA